MTFLILVPAFVCSLLAPGVCANPYGVAGTGVLSKLGMPAGCSEYSWDTLQPANPINMVRPCKYWISIGQTHKYWGYHETTDSIDDPAQFATWVTRYPGKTWIIGNEPDLGSQDGLTIEQYARMFHCYYTFITALDPTAKFAIGAVTGGSIASALAYTQNWYQQVLNTYQTLYGVTMPIDIWNVHSYCGANQIDDPDKIINDFVNPFIAWCHTVNSGAYAACPVWITELPVGEWIGAMSPENVIYFMQHYVPRLEQTGIEKWFWYVSVDWDGKQGSCSLTRSGQVTSVGSAYAALANGYPNAVPPVVPFVPDPTPDSVSFDFSGTFGAPWFNKGGWWSNSSGELRHTGIYPFPATTCCPLYVYRDFSLSFKLRINSAAADTNWGAVLLRTASRLNSHSDSGYLVFLRQNGELGLYNKYDSIVASVPNAVADSSVWHDFQIYVIGSRIEVYLDGVKRIDWTDPNSRFASGYTVAQVYKADASYDDFRLLVLPKPAPLVTDDGAYTTDLSRLHGSWTFSGSGHIGYQYSVGSIPGNADIAGWVSTEAADASVPLSLTPGTTYYLNARAVYPGGTVGPIGSSDGITAAASPATIRELKMLGNAPLSLLRDKVVSGICPGGFYIQEPDRQSGIKVLGSISVDPGDRVTLAGIPALDGVEAVLSSPVLLERSRGYDPPSPLGMNTLATGGGACGLQSAVVNDAAAGSMAAGLCTTGLLVRVAGKVTYVDPLETYAYLDDGRGIKDGSGNLGVRVMLDNVPLPAVGAYGSFAGLCGAVDVSGKCARCLRPRSSADACFASFASYLRNGGFESGAYSPWAYSGTGGGIRSGTYYSVKAHTGSRFFGCYGPKVTYSGTLRQTVTVPAGNYRASAWSVLFHPYTTDPEVTKNRIGIDPTGGTDPGSGSVVWSEWDTTTSTTITPWHEIMTPVVNVPGGQCTVFLEYLQQNAAYYHNNCFDDARLTGVEE